MQAKFYDEKARADVTATQEEVANAPYTLDEKTGKYYLDKSKLPPDHLDVKELKARKAHQSELEQLTSVYSSLVAKFEGKREGAIACSNPKAAMPLCREAESIRGQIEKTRTAISEARARYQLSLEEIRDDRVDRIRGLCTARGIAECVFPSNCYMTPAATSARHPRQTKRLVIADMSFVGQPCPPLWTQLSPE